MCRSYLLTVCLPLLTLAVHSLSAACQFFLGKPLLKSQRMSDWDMRPLLPEQILYASLDAHATLAVFDRIVEQHIGAIHCDQLFDSKYSTKVTGSEVATTTPIAQPVHVPTSPSQSGDGDEGAQVVDTAAVSSAAI